MIDKTTKGNTKRTQTPLTDMARGKAHEALDKVALSSAELEKKARQGAQQTEQKIAEITNITQQAGQVYLDKVSQYTQKNPIMALGIAVASGYIVSKLVSKKG